MKKAQPIAPYPHATWLSGRYEVRRKLGQGGFAVVYLVYDHVDDHVYAFKVLHPELARRASVRNRFRREAQVWLHLGGHPHLVQAHFVDVVKGQWVLAIDYVSPDARGCTSLADHLKAGPLALDVGLRWAIQCCYALSFAYQRGLKSHRDLKPANILIDQGHTVKVTDLGLARALDADGAFEEIDLGTLADTADLEVVTQGGQRLGTPTHMSPEQFVDPARCDEASDIYSFGVVLYEMATGGNLPFSTRPPTQRTPEDLQAYIARLEAQHAAVPAPLLPEPWGSIIARCLQKQRDQRFSSFDALRRELEQVLEAIGGPSVPTPRLEQLGPQRLVERGNSFSRLRDYHKAVQAFEEALQADAGLAAAWDGKGMALCALGRTTDALAALEQAVVLAPARADVHLHRGEVLTRLHRYEDALQAYEQALERDWRHLAALNNKGQVHFIMRHYDEALLCFDMAATIDPDHAGYWYNKGVVFLHREHPEQAADAFRATVEAAPEWNAGWIGLGFVALDQGRIPEAEEHLGRARSRKGQEAAVWQGMGYAHAMQAAYQEALDCFQKALEHAPQNGAAWVNSAVMLYKLQRPSLAGRSLRVATQMDPKEAGVWYNQGTFYLLNHDPTRAAAALYRACELRPDLAPGFYNLGLALHLQEVWDDAAAAYQQAYGLGWRTPVLGYNLGVCLAAVGQYAAAADLLTNLAQEDPEALNLLQRCRDAAAGRSLADHASATWRPRTRPLPGLRLLRRLTPLPFRDMETP